MKKEVVTFELSKDKKIILHLIKNPKENFIAKVPFLSPQIYIGNSFYKFSNHEQKAIIFHELWHRENNLKFEVQLILKKPWKIFSSNWISKKQELEADAYAARQTDKQTMVNVLKKLKKDIESGELTYNFKNHPTIEERIKNIKS